MSGVGIMVSDPGPVQFQQEFLKALHLFSFKGSKIRMARIQGS